MIGLSVVELLLLMGTATLAPMVFIAVRRTRKHSAYARWRSLLEEVAGALGGRVSAPHPNEAPQLRAEMGGRTVTLTLDRFGPDPTRIRALAQVALPDEDNLVRLYVGWDAPGAPPDFAHVPEQVITIPPGLDGRLRVQTEDSGLAEHFVERAAVDLLDVRRETEARSIEVRVRGGYLTVNTHGTRPTAPMLERTMRAAQRLSEEIHGISKDRSSHE